jgi:glycosyltransferase involved in cell wall biosynthesis
VVKRVAFAVPGDLATPTGGYAYDRRIIAELRALGFAVRVINLGEGFPRPNSVTRAAARMILERLPADMPVIIDGLAYGALPQLANDYCAARRVIALVHHPLALETGLANEEAAQLQASERAALAGARHVIASSAPTARILAADYGVPRERITVAPPGSDRVERARGSAGRTVALLSVGALVPRKGYDILIAALARLTDLDWHLTIAGPCDRDAATTQQIVAQVTAAGLDPRVTLAGAVPPDRLAELYRTADLFVLASRFEGYGMAFAEAASCGLPIIGTTTGAIPLAVMPGAGLLVPPDDVAALAAALRRLIGDPKERAGFAEAAFAAADRLPTWDGSARLIAAVVEAVA